MPRGKNHKKLSKWLSYAPLVLALIISIAFAYTEGRQHVQASDYFSSESLQSFRALNFEYGIVIEDIFEEKSKSPVIAELFAANVLLTEPISKVNRGLIATVEDEDSSSTLLLQPLENYSIEELEVIAVEYEEFVPEFAHLEVDQELDLSGYPVYTMKFPPVLKLADEEDEPALSPIKIAVVDSGVDSKHEVFAHTEMMIGWNTVDGNEEMYDDVGHGTHIAGIIAGKVPGAVIAPYKIVNKNGGRLSNVLIALDHALEDGVDIINTSFGLMSESYALENLVERIYKEGVIMVSAAGNNNTDSGFYPATYEHTIAVGSVDVNGKKMEKSNYGFWVDFAAYGYRIRSALPGNKYGYKSGTSQATAFVSAAVAELLIRNGLDKRLSFEEIVEALAENGSLISEGELAGAYIVE